MTNIVGIADRPVMVFHRKVVQLEYQHIVGYEPLIVRPTVGALAPQQLLIPATTCLDVVDRDEGLWSHRRLLVLMMYTAKYSTPVQCDTACIALTIWSRGRVRHTPGVVEQRQPAHLSVVRVRFITESEVSQTANQGRDEVLMLQRPKTPRLRVFFHALCSGNQ